MREKGEEGKAKPPGLWAEDFSVRSYEVDCHGRLSIPSICNFLQEAAGSHARSLGVAIQQIIGDNYTWVLSRLLVRMDAYPAWGETVRVETWPSGTRGPFAMRDFRMTGSGGLSVGAACAAWLLIDARTRFPLRRVEAVLSKLQTPANAPPSLGGTLAKLPALDGADQEARFRVGYGDLDVNRHVNNVIYIGWVMESLPVAVHDNTVPAELEVHYIAEAFAGDEILSRCRKEGDGLTFLHGVFRESDGQELLRARTVWKEQRKP